MSEAGAAADPLDATQYLVSSARSDLRAPAWGRLSEKIEHHVRKRYGHRRIFPLGYELDDFLMDVMVRVLLELDKYRPTQDGTFWNWLYRVGDNIMIDLARMDKALKRGGDRKRIGGEDGEDLMGQVPDKRTPTPTMFARHRELNAAEMECVERLGETPRRVYTLRRQGLAFAEISTELGQRSEATLRSDYKRARAVVQQCMRSRMDGLGESFDGWHTGASGADGAEADAGSV